MFGRLVLALIACIQVAHAQQPFGIPAPRGETPGRVDTTTLSQMQIVSASLSQVQNLRTLAQRISAKVERLDDQLASVDPVLLNRLKSSLVDIRSRAQRMSSALSSIESSLSSIESSLRSGRVNAGDVASVRQSIELAGSSDDADAIEQLLSESQNLLNSLSGSQSDAASTERVEIAQDLQTLRQSIPTNDDLNRLQDIISDLSTPPASPSKPLSVLPSYGLGAGASGWPTGGNVSGSFSILRYRFLIRGTYPVTGELITYVSTDNGAGRGAMSYATSSSGSPITLRISPFLKSWRTGPDLLTIGLQADGRGIVFEDTLRGGMAMKGGLNIASGIVYSGIGQAESGDEVVPGTWSVWVMPQVFISQPSTNRRALSQDKWLVPGLEVMGRFRGIGNSKYDLSASLQFAVGKHRRLRLAFGA